MEFIWLQINVKILVFFYIISLSKDFFSKWFSAQSDETTEQLNRKTKINTASNLSNAYTLRTVVIITFHLFHFLSMRM